MDRDFLPVIYSPIRIVPWRTWSTGRILFVVPGVPPVLAANRPRREKEQSLRASRSHR